MLNCPEDFDFIFYSEMDLQTEDWDRFEYKWKNQPSQKEDIDSGSKPPMIWGQNHTGLVIRRNIFVKPVQRR